MSALACAKTDSLAVSSIASLPVAERNAAQGFNDTIDRLADDFVEVYLSITEPGDYLYTTLGHAAYHLKCPTFGLDYYFTMEGENTPDAVFRFLKGNLKMGLAAIPAKEYLSPYVHDNRGVTEYKINLSPLQKQTFWALLDEYTHKWENLPYDYFHHSCAISLMELMYKLGGRDEICYAEPWEEKFHHTAGDLVYFRLRETHPWVLSFIRLLAGNEVDEKRPNDQKLMIPADLLEVWQKATLRARPLLDSEPIEILPKGDRGKVWFTPTMASILLLVAAVVSLFIVRTDKHWLIVCGKIVDSTIWGLVTLLGLFLTYLLFFSNLPCTDWNWLYIAFNPLPAICWFWRKYWALPYAICMIIWTIAMMCMPYMAAYSEHIILTIAWVIVLFKQYYVEYLRKQKYKKDEN